MIVGLDTSFLVQLEVVGHPGHTEARSVMERLLDEGSGLALAPQVLAEFIHVRSDTRRFTRPLSVRAAQGRSQQWWNATDMVHACPTDAAIALFHAWLQEFQLGRKRLLDTMLAATYCAHEIKWIASTNARDFRVFGRFDVIET